MKTLGGLREAVLEVQDLTVDFPTDDGVVHAVRGVSYSLYPGEVLGIVGESGSGKSVSALATLGLLPKTADISGSMRFRGEELIGRTQKELNEVRGNGISMIFQDPMTSLNPVQRVGNQIAEIVRAHRDVSRKDAWNRAVEMLGRVGIPNAAARARMYPHEYSGGMRQRAMIAMALANDPAIVIADEPTTALDVTVQAQILELLHTLKDEFDSAVILITHDLGVVAGMADRLLVMYAGRPVEQGETLEVFRQPLMPYTLGLLGAIPRLDSDGTERLVPITGAPPSLVNLPRGCPFEARCPMAAELCADVEPVMRSVGRDPNHLAACHYAERLASPDVEPAAIFPTSSADPGTPSVGDDLS